MEQRIRVKDLGDLFQALVRFGRESFQDESRHFPPVEGDQDPVSHAGGPVEAIGDAVGKGSLHGKIDSDPCTGNVRDSGGPGQGGLRSIVFQ